MLLLLLSNFGQVTSPKLIQYRFSKDVFMMTRMIRPACAQQNRLYSPPALPKGSYRIIFQVEGAESDHRSTTDHSS
jgi:hypothetical protein